VGSAPQPGIRRWRRAVSGWPLWELPPWLVAFVLAVIAAFGAAIAAALALTSFHDYGGYNIELFAVLLGCDVVTVELTRRSGEPGGGLIKETHAVWELPIALLLPPLYGLIAPIVRLALTQWRVRQTLVYRRIFTAAALGLTYAAVSVAFRALASPLTGFFASPKQRVEVWALAALACGVLRSVLNKVLVMTAVKGADPAVSIRAELFTREALFGDLAELSIGVLVAYVVTASPLLGLLALPCVTLLQRSLRHGQLVNDARIDGLTRMLNKTTWHREAAVRVTRATRPRAWRALGRAGDGTHGDDLPASSGRSGERRSDSTRVALLVVDIDRFKLLQDTCGGHEVGDIILEAIADTIRAQLRDSDLCGRYGGDEFAILLPDTSADEALAVARRLCLAVSQLTISAAFSGLELPDARATVSVGVAALDRAHVDLDELLRAADGAMYQAKGAGRNTVRMVAV
jgi:diguanylate cyclase (GGDEF)-like protein